MPRRSPVRSKRVSGRKLDRETRARSRVDRDGCAELFGQACDHHHPHRRTLCGVHIGGKAHAVVRDGQAEVARVVLRFEMTALRLLGHLPALHGCAACGQEIETTGRVLFGQLAGGLLCEHCRPGQRQVVNVTAATVSVLRQFAASEGNTWRNHVWDGPTFGEVRGVIGQYMCQLLDHRPRMHRYLGLLGHTRV